jgi:hypothetical protein
VTSIVIIAVVVVVVVVVDGVVVTRFCFLKILFSQKRDLLPVEHNQF